MSNIIERLQRAALGRKEAGAWPELHTAAIDEIERLQKIESAARDVVSAHDDADMEHTPIGALSKALQTKGRCTPADPEDVRQYKAAVREHVVQPIKERAAEQQEAADRARSQRLCENSWHSGEMSSSYCPHCRDTWKT